MEIKLNKHNLKLITILIVSFAIVNINEVFCFETSSEKAKCEEITIPMCRGIGYNYTVMPNQFNQDSQDEAGLEVHQFYPLVEISCSDDLRFFLCSMYTPICMDDYHGSLPACRSVCERAKAGCAPIMLKYGFAWPERMNCDDLPKYGDQERLCMDSKDGEEPPKPTTPKTTTEFVSTVSTKVITTKEDSREKEKGRITNTSNKGKTYKTKVDVKQDVKGVVKAIVNIPPVFPDCCECRLIPITDITDKRYYNRVETGGIVNCAQPCHTVFFKEPEQSVAVFWITVFAIACAICTSLTVLTFITDTERFRYPERSIIFLSGCYFMVSMGFIIRSYVGHEPIVCDGRMIRYQGTGPAPGVCVVVFLFIYFFGMASSVWWVILTLTWFLAAGLKWSNEAIAGYSQFFHLIAWFVPAVKSIIILSMGAIDGDSFTGICYVGNEDLNNLKGFVLYPLCIYLCLGFMFLLAGFISLFRIRNVIRQQARAKADKLEKLMIRIVIFSILYIVPGSIVIACNFYEYKNRKNWETSYNCPCSISNNKKPYYSIFLLKYIACLVVGITSGFWIWSGKTIDSWFRFYGRLCCPRSSSNSRSGTSQLIAGSQYMTANSQRSYKHIPTPQIQPAYSSTSHIPHLHPPSTGPHSKIVPPSHV